MLQLFDLPEVTSSGCFTEMVAGAHGIHSRNNGHKLQPVVQPVAQLPPRASPCRATLLSPGRSGPFAHPHSSRSTGPLKTAARPARLCGRGTTSTWPAMPSSESDLGPPSERVRRLTSSSLRGVPSGLVVSQRDLAPVNRRSRPRCAASSPMVMSVPTPTLIVRRRRRSARASTDRRAARSSTCRNSRRGVPVPHTRLRVAVRLGLVKLADHGGVAHGFSSGRSCPRARRGSSASPRCIAAVLVAIAPHTRCPAILAIA